MRVRTCSSVIGPVIADYLALKQALGRHYRTESDILQHLDAFLVDRRDDLTAETFALWCRTRAHLTSGVRRNWMRVVRNLCLYRRRRDPTCFVPDPLQFPLPHQPVRPHIFTEAEITRLLDEAGRLAAGNRSPVRAENMRLAVVLLYTAGLRRGELQRLMVSDYDRRERTLLVRESKFHKSRLLPLSDDAVRELETYLRTRRARGFPSGSDAPLVWHAYGRGGAYTGAGLGQSLRCLFKVANIRTAADGWPRVHDIRHTFAVQALLRWYRAGEDVQAKLPYLATYMGHVSIVSTQHYLHFIEQLAASASERFERRCGTLITAPGPTQRTP
jgi:integrase